MMERQHRTNIGFRILPGHNRYDGKTTLKLTWDQECCLGAPDVMERQHRTNIGLRILPGTQQT